MTSRPHDQGSVRLVLLGDTHGGNGPVNRALALAAELGAPTVVQLGDFGFWGGFDGEWFIDAVQQAARASGVTLAVIEGNHDRPDDPGYEAFSIDPDVPFDPSVPGQGLLHLPRGTRFALGGLTFACVGGACSIDRDGRTPGKSWWPSECLTASELRRIVADGPADVLLSHDAPLLPPGFSIWTSGSRALQEDMELQRQRMADVFNALRPSWAFHGHFHHRYEAAIQHAGGACIVHGLAAVGLTL